MVKSKGNAPCKQGDHHYKDFTARSFLVEEKRGKRILNVYMGG